MYAQHFGLKALPFSTQQPAELLLTTVHREALATILFGVVEGRPLTVVIGEVGTGKTTVLQAALRQLRTRGTRLLEVVHPMLSADELIGLVARELGAGPVDGFSVATVERINERLDETSGEGGPLVLVIDEAQAMPQATLESLRLLLNCRGAQQGLLRLVLVGQNELWTILSSPQFEHLRQRISLRALLSPLSKAEARRYLAYRCQLAGAQLDRLMTPRAIRLICRASGGLPRQINTIADNALITAYGNNLHCVTGSIAREAISAVAPRRSGNVLRWIGVVAGAAATIAAITFVAIGLTNPASERGASDRPITGSSKPPSAPPTTVSLMPPRPVESLVTAPANDDTKSGTPANPPPQVSPDTVSARASDQMEFSPAPELPVSSSEAFSSGSSSSPSVPPAAAETKSAVPVAPPPQVSSDTVPSPAPAPVGSNSVTPTPVEQRAASLDPKSAPTRQSSKPPSQTAIVVVQPGDSVFQLLLKYYGHHDEEALRLFKTLNPSIMDPSHILTGSKLYLPEQKD